MRIIEPKSPLVISVPHAGQRIPEEIEARLTIAGRSRIDTDWHVDRLAEGLEDLGAGLIVAECSRYVIDLNRPPDDQPLYSGPTTGLVPTETFSGAPLYLEGQAPGKAEIEARRAAYWQPYHEAIESQLARAQARFGHAVLLDLHSILSRVPRLFEGELPELNLGTNLGASCAAPLRAAVSDQLAVSDFSHVIDGRFKGGYITRHYGQPSSGRHAIQLEIAQRCYLDESQPDRWDPARAEPLQSWLASLVGFLMSWRPTAP